MDTKSNSLVKEIIFNLDELIAYQDEYAADDALLSSFLYDWVDNSAKLSAIWNIASEQQLAQVTSKYEEVKPIAMKLKLPWPEELK